MFQRTPEFWGLDENYIILKKPIDLVSNIVYPEYTQNLISRKSKSEQRQNDLLSTLVKLSLMMKKA